jgi:hypothetical protein
MKHTILINKLDVSIEYNTFDHLEISPKYEENSWVIRHKLGSTNFSVWSNYALTDGPPEAAFATLEEALDEVLTYT